MLRCQNILTKTAAPSMIGKSKLTSLRTKGISFGKIGEVQKLKYVIKKTFIPM